MANRYKQCKTNKTDARLVLLLERRTEIHVDENGRHITRRLLNLPIAVMIDLNAQQKTGRWKTGDEINRGISPIFFNLGNWLTMTSL